MPFHGLSINKLSCCCWFMSWVFHFVKWLIDFVKLVLSSSCEGPKWIFDIWDCWLSFWCCWMNWTKTGFSCENQRLSVFANKWLWKVLGKWFWVCWNLNFTVDYDRVKCQECVGENGTEIRLMVWILRAKWWKRKKRKIGAIRRARPCVYRHGPCVHSVFVGTGHACCQDFISCVFRAFSPIFVLNWPLT